MGEAHSWIIRRSTASALSEVQVWGCSRASSDQTAPSRFNPPGNFSSLTCQFPKLAARAAVRSSVPVPLFSMRTGRQDGVCVHKGGVEQTDSQVQPRSPRYRTPGPGKTGQRRRQGPAGFSQVPGCGQGRTRPAPASVDRLRSSQIPFMLRAAVSQNFLRKGRDSLRRRGVTAGARVEPGAHGFRR